MDKIAATKPKPKNTTKDKKTHETPDHHSSKAQSDNEQFIITGYTNKYAGRVTLYPTNNVGLALLKMIHGRRQSFTAAEIKTLKSIGYKIKIVENVIETDWESE